MHQMLSVGERSELHVVEHRDLTGKEKIESRIENSLTLSCNIFTDKTPDGLLVFSLHFKSFEHIEVFNFD